MAARKQMTAVLVQGRMIWWINNYKLGTSMLECEYTQTT